MNSERTRQILEEFQSLGIPHADPELAAVNAALMIEDAFGVHLTDADIGPDLLSSPERVHGLQSRS